MLMRPMLLQLTEYLKQTPCSTQSPEQIQKFLEAFSQFDLTRGEKLQILNLRPKSAVDIYLVNDLHTCSMAVLEGTQT